jgi:hypothetical protein
MAFYLFEIELPADNEEMVNHIPEHRKHINELFAKGTILSYSVSLQRSFIWCVIKADDEREAMDIVAGFPLRKYFLDAVCHPLLFHNILPADLPQIFLN